MSERPYVLFVRDRNRGAHWHSVARYETRKEAEDQSDVWKRAGDNLFHKIKKMG